MKTPNTQCGRDVEKALYLDQGAECLLHECSIVSARKVFPARFAVEACVIGCLQVTGLGRFEKLCVVVCYVHTTGSDRHMQG